MRGSVSGNPGLGRVRRHTGQFEHVHWPWAQVQLPVDVHPQSGILQGGGGGGGGLFLMGDLERNHFVTSRVIWSMSGILKAGILEATVLKLRVCGGALFLRLPLSRRLVMLLRLLAFL